MLLPQVTHLQVHVELLQLRHDGCCGRVQGGVERHARHCVHVEGGGLAGMWGDRHPRGSVRDDEQQLAHAGGVVLPLLEEV